MEDPKAHSDTALQQVLLRFSEAAQAGSDSASLIQLFCRETREFFGVDGTYFWQLDSAGELVGMEADGLMADHFRGRRLFFEDSGIAIEAVRQRKALCVNHVNHGRHSRQPELPARSLMAVPLFVFGQAVGAAVFVHSSRTNFFHAGSMAKATILASQLGSLLEAKRSSPRLPEDGRQAAILTEVAEAVRVVPDTSTVAEAIAEHLRSLLRTTLVAIFLRDGEQIALEAVAATSPQLRSALRAGFVEKGLEFASELVGRAVAAGEVISVPVGPAVSLTAGLAVEGMLLAAPFRTSRTYGAIAVYPRAEGPFSAQEKSLLSAVSGFGAVAIANAELCRVARFQAEELEQLLEISSELHSIARLDEFLERVAQRAADFLGFDLGFVALREEETLRLRATSNRGSVGSSEAVLEGDLWTRALAAKDVFTSEDGEELTATNFRWLTSSPVRQLLAVPLLAANGEELGIVGVVDRRDGAAISEAHRRSALALSAHLTVALEALRRLHRSEEQLERAEALVRLAWQWNRQLQLPDLAKQFVAHAAQLMGAHAALLAVSEAGSWEILALDPTWEGNPSFSGARFEVAIPRLLEGRGEAIVSCKLEELLAGELGTAVGSYHGSLVRLQTGSGQLMGVLCLTRQKPLERGEEQLLQAIAAHASIAFENAQLFTRMEASNRHWGGIFDAITDFIVAHDRSDNVVQVNRSLADFIGVEPKELIGVKTHALFALTTGFAPQACPFCGGISEQGKDHVLAFLDRIYLVSTSRVEGAEGVETIHVLKDITDRREAERRYRELFDNVQEGVFFAAADGCFVEVNDTLMHLLAYDSREQLLKLDIRTQVFSSPERYDQFAALMLEHGAVRNHEQALRRKDGSSIHVLINAFAVRDAERRVMQYRGVILDISGLKNFQSELQRERDFSAKILNNTQSLILVADSAGLISYANRRWHEMGYQPDLLWGRPLEELIAAPRRPELREALAATLAGQQVDNLELQLVRGGGGVGHFSLNLSPMRDEQGKVANIVVVMSDITDAASLQAKLIHAEKMAAVGQLVSGVAHEVNNPLTAILGFADLLLENPEVPESARKDLRVILQEAQRTKQIVQNLLSFARPMPPQRKPIELNTILDRTVQLRAYDFHSRGVEVLEHLDRDLHPVVGDSHQLQQVFLNILNNAYDAVRDTGRAARIEIRTANLDHQVEVAFRDNGQGVKSPERIFDPFFTTKEIGKGTGLGLSICQGIVREHGGEITCHNNADGEGATFIVRLPAVQEPASVGAAAGVAPP